MALKGELSDVPINEIFSLLKNTKSSGILFIDFEGKRFKIHFFNGEVINAEGDATPESSLEFVLGLKNGSFEFDKNADTKKAANLDNIKKVLSNMQKIQAEWNKLRKAFPSENVVIALSETNKEEIELSGTEWKIISILKNPKTISQISKESGIGIFELLKVLSNMLQKDLIAVKGEESPEKTLEEDLKNVVPVRLLGYWATRSPIEGIKAIEFYRRVDDKKTVVDIAKEMGISLKEASEILEYLVKNDKLEKKLKRK